MSFSMQTSKTSKKIIPPEWPHLKPLSDHSRRVTCDQKTSLHPPRRFSNPFINFKIEVVSNCTSNRKMDDSSVDEGYETPAKKAWIPKALSPDLGCYMDYCSPLTRRQSVSPLSTSNPAFLHKTQGTRSATKENVNLCLESDVVFFRTVTLKRGVDWEYRKNQYVHSVTQHMTKSVMSELLNLMSHVAKQTAGSNGTRWQHPSDLTRRNYQESFGNATPRMTLRDWLARNSPTHKRFAKVPKRLERTPFP
uniref:S100P-binding protein n=1 Tax=Amphiprion ocellaris TaxID=80972 RepID=A0AAQ6AIM8_AMPOC